MCVMLVQRFELQGRHFTNFPYYYYQLLFLLWQLILGYKLDKSLLPPKKLFGNQTEAFIKKRQQELQVYLQTVLHYLAHHPPPALTFFLDFHLYVSILLSVFVFHLRHLQCIQVSWDFHLFTLIGGSCHKYCPDMCIVVTKHVFRRDKSMLVVTSMLVVFVMCLETRVCCDKYFVLSWQVYFCQDKRHVKTKDLSFSCLLGLPPVCESCFLSYFSTSDRFSAYRSAGTFTYRYVRKHSLSC